MAAIYTEANYLVANPQGYWALSSRLDFLKLEQENQAAIKRIYDDAAAHLSDKLTGLNNATLEVASLRSMQSSVLKESNLIGKSLRERLILDTSKAAQYGAASVQKPLFENLIAQGGGKFSEAGLIGSMTSTSNLAVVAQWIRSANGLMLSDRIWSTATTFRKELTALVNFASASGIGSKELSRLITRLAQEGGYQLKATLLKDYPKAAARLGKYFKGNTNWEALRLARTELAVSYNSAAVMAGRQTPGYIGARWMLSSSHPEVDICDDYASSDPDGLGPGCYSKGNEPVYAHPNCLCYTVPLLSDRETFNTNLSKWIGGGSWPEMDNWYSKIYLGTMKR